MNKLTYQYIIIISLMLGAILGILSKIPYAGGLALTLMLLFSAPIVIVFLIMAGKLDLTTPKDSIMTGASIGFFSNITFSSSYSILSAVLFLTAKYTDNYLLTTMITNSPIWLLITAILFIGVLTSVTNAFAGFVTYYIINLIRDIYERKHANGD